MKTKATTLFLGLCLAILAVATSPAHAQSRSETAFGTFHVEINTLTKYASNPYLCLYENNGAVVNHCKFTVGLAFGLPIDSTGTKNIVVQNGWAAIETGTGSESCQSFAYTGSEGSSNVGTHIDFTGATQSLTTTVSVSDGAKSIQVLCTVPEGDAIANLTWNP